MRALGVKVLSACSVAVCGVAQGNLAAQTERQAEAPVDWEGIWVAERSFGPDLKGPVVLQSSGDGWAARIQGESVPVEQTTQEDGTRRWAFSVLGQGYFIGHQSAAGEAITGHWYQPPGKVQNYPFASPVRIMPAGNDAFSGTIRPFPQTLSLNIPLMPESGDSGDDPTRYRTFLRNPERNIGVFFRVVTATVDGDEIQFKNTDGDVRFTGNSVVPGRQFSLRLRRGGDVFDFTRRSRRGAVGFYPRRSPEAPPALLQPVQTDDGWRTASPAETGLNVELLSDMVSGLATFEPTGLRKPYIHGLLIAHRGKLVVEEYFHGFDRDTPHDSRSAGKSIASALLGVALERGLVSSIDEPVYSFFGGVEAFANPDPRKEQMTLRHLVTMSPGFECDDGNSETRGNEDTMQSQSEQPDWYRYTLDLPMVAEPGAKDAYCTAGINLIGGALKAKTGMSLPRFFHESFAEPLDIDHYYMNLSPKYEGYMGGGIRLRPRDFMKLGQLYLDGGVWNGKRLVSEDWVNASAAPHSSLNTEDDYGFAWWRQEYEVNGKIIDTYFASGNGGQMTFVVPELELVVQFNAGNYSDGRTRGRWRDRLMGEFILPAAVN
ncbi:serine hydrolase [uncultured Erythrobacter sp.]|uniref:serine hydrolase domain-containing protein n=1 Tax=uncultured Erythrobacter sp. TaxID=263913 RepID=UPI00260A8040|nr:serine hydrolase [uncultured Erythrobacter sp.]